MLLVCFYQETVIDLLKRSLWRDLTPPELAKCVLVVHRKDRRGPFYTHKTWNDPRLGPGWWALEGNGQLWVLKALEEIGRVKYIKVRILLSQRLRNCFSK